MASKEDLEEGEVAVDTLEPDLQDEVKLQKKQKKVKKNKTTKGAPGEVPDSLEESKASTVDSFEKIEKKLKTENKPNVKKGKNEFTSSTFKTKPCEFYRKGACHKGNECTFSHDFPGEGLSEVCKYYLTGNCTKGDNCVFSHDLKKYPCKFFWGTGNCTQGAQCRFSHDPIQDERKGMEFIEDNEDFFMQIYQKYRRTNLGNLFLAYLQKKAAEQNKEQKSQFLLIPPSHDQTNYHNQGQNPHFNQNPPSFRPQPHMDQSRAPPHMQSMPNPGIHGKVNPSSQPGFFDPNIGPKNQFMQPPPPIQNFQQKPIQYAPINNHPPVNNYQQRPVQHNPNFAPQNLPYGHQGPYNQHPGNQHLSNQPHPNMGMNYQSNNNLPQGPIQNTPQHLQPQMPHIHPHMGHHQQYPQNLEDPKPLLTHPMHTITYRNDPMGYNMQGTMNNQNMQTPQQMKQPMHSIQPMQAIQQPMPNTQHMQLVHSTQANQHVPPPQLQPAINPNFNKNFQENSVPPPTTIPMLTPAPNPTPMPIPQPQSIDPRRRINMPSVNKYNPITTQPESLKDPASVQPNPINNQPNAFIQRDGPQAGNLNPFLVQSSMNQPTSYQNQTLNEDRRGGGPMNENLHAANIFLPNKEFEDNTSRNIERFDKPAAPSQYNQPKGDRVSPMKNESRNMMDERNVREEIKDESTKQNNSSSTSLKTYKIDDATNKDENPRSKKDFWGVVKSKKGENIRSKQAEQEGKSKHQINKPLPPPSKIIEELKRPEIKKLFDQKALLNTLGVSMQRDSYKIESQGEIEKLFSTLEFYPEKSQTPMKNTKDQLKTSIQETIKSLRELLNSND